MNDIKNWLENEWKDNKFKKYITVNIIVLILLVLVFYIYEYGFLKSLRYTIIFLGMILITWIDRKFKIIPNKILIFLLSVRGIILAIECLTCFEISGMLLISTFIGMLVGGGIFMLAKLISRGGVGMGDVKLFVIIGSYVGNAVIVPLIFFTVFSSAIYSICQLIRKKTSLKDDIPFAPFIFIGMIITFGMGF